jgi:hypothetical protein
MRARSFAFCFTIVASLCLNFLSAQNLTDTLFSEDFESNGTWGIFEELVGGNPCYGDSLGQVMISADYAYGGSHGLRIWSNKDLQSKSNHVIGQLNISNDGMHGLFSLSCYAFIPPETDTAQVGPEFSMQSTRNNSGTNLTFTAGIQYVQSPWGFAKWNIWHNAQWQQLDTSIFNFHLIKNTWYGLQLHFINDSAYLSFSVKGEGIDTTVDLSQPFAGAPAGFKITGEDKGFMPSTMITLEAENLWTHCLRPVQAKMYYDNVCLMTDPAASVPSPDASALKVYPIPASDDIIIETGNASGNLFIHSLEGKLLKYQPLMKGKTRIDIKGLEKGVYLVKFISDDSAMVKKFIKE